MKLSRGTIVMVDLDPAVGHEQRGRRPCIIVSDPEIVGDQRFPLICIVPVTGTPGEGLLYPGLTPEASGLAKRSFALIDQLSSVDKRRIQRLFGKLSPEEISAVDEGPAVFLGLNREHDSEAAL